MSQSISVEEQETPGVAEEAEKQVEGNPTPLRSPNYGDLSPREQWEEDKRHGYLDLGA